MPVAISRLDWNNKLSIRDQGGIGNRPHAAQEAVRSQLEKGEDVQQQGFGMRLSCMSMGGMRPKELPECARRRHSSGLKPCPTPSSVCFVHCVRSLELQPMPRDASEPAQDMGPFRSTLFHFEQMILAEEIWCATPAHYFHYTCWVELCLWSSLWNELDLEGSRVQSVQVQVLPTGCNVLGHRAGSGAAFVRRCCELGLSLTTTSPAVRLLRSSVIF